MWVNKMKIGRIALFATALFAVPAMATTYYVGGNNASDDNDGSSGAPFATIAKAATMVAAGDTIQIADGRYVISSPVEIALANVTVVGAGREAVVIDGQGASRGIVASGANFTLRNLTVSNCVATVEDAATGAGICLGANGWTLDSVAIVCCTNESTTVYGGGAYLEKAGTATNCLFACNAAASGGAAFCAYTDTGVFRQTFQSCVFTNNAAIGAASGTSGNGGALYGQNTSSSKILFKLVGCFFSGNSAALNGGAISCRCDNSNNGSSVEEATDTVFADNVALAGNGGAVSGRTNAAANMTHRYVRCSFLRNTAWTNGGGVIVPHGQFRNCLFSENEAGRSGSTFYYGGAIYAGEDSAIENCTFVGNSVNNYYTDGSHYSKGGAIYGGNLVGMTNCVFFANSAAMVNNTKHFPWKYMNIYLTAESWNIAANCLEANHPDYPSFNLATRGTATTDPETGEVTISGHLVNGENGCKVGSFDAAAFFANYAGGDYVPKKNGALIDAGIVLDWMDGTTDIRNDPKFPRIVDAAPDIGCYEFKTTLQGFILIFR